MELWIEFLMRGMAAGVGGLAILFLVLWLRDRSRRRRLEELVVRDWEGVLERPLTPRERRAMIDYQIGEVEDWM